jgi:exosome complex component RRP41
VEELYKKHQIEISVTVIQNEGSAKSAVMNCISMALVNAGVAMRDLLVSCTVGMIGSRVLVDPNEEEEYEIVN